jgi:hypothetical protein
VLIGFEVAPNRSDTPQNVASFEMNLSDSSSRSYGRQTVGYALQLRSGERNYNNSSPPREIAQDYSMA